jgi:hypothetical protein
MPRPHPVAPLDLGRIIGGTLGVLRRGGLVIVSLAILLDWLPNGLQTLIFDALRPQLAGHPYQAAALSSVLWLTFPLADMAVVAAALAVIGGRRPSVGGAIATALRFFPAAVILDVFQNLVNLLEPWLLTGKPSDLTTLGALVVEIAYGLASAALLLPSLAAAIQERAGPGPALVRSAAVTQGNRIRIGAFAGLLLVLQMLIARILQELIVAGLGAGPFSVWVALLPNALIFAFASASQAVLYWELARLKDGLAPEDLDAVFG